MIFQDFPGGWQPRTNTTIVSKELHLYDAVINNVKILNKNNKWGHLQFPSSISWIVFYKTLAPEIDFDLKASEEMNFK